MSSDAVTLFYSFRSPYSWLAFRRVQQVLPSLGVELRPIAVFPPPGMTPASTSTPRRLQYTMADAARMAAAYGLTMRSPEPLDTEWVRPHACAYWAAEQGRGDAFIAAAHAARFERGADLGASTVQAELAREVGLDADACVAAADDGARHAQVWQGMQEAQATGIFGVPTFVYEGELFWGNDRLEWLLRAVARVRGEVVPDLEADPFAAPWARCATGAMSS
jgi:2-hydroxychromene-2-carboxylate isomerase